MTRILLVEDEPSLAAGVRDDLQAEGYTVDHVTGAAIATVNFMLVRAAPGEDAPQRSGDFSHAAAGPRRSSIGSSYRSSGASYRDLVRAC